MSFYKLYGDVISKNLCTDCGACMLVCPEKVIALEETELSFEPQLIGRCLGEKCAMCIQVCPGAYIPRTDIEKKILGRTRKNSGLEQTQGVLQRVCIGQWKDERVLRASGAGGVVTGLLVYALEKGLIEGAILAGPREGRPWLSQARVATTPREVIEMAGSRYDSFPQLLGLAAALGYELNAVTALLPALTSLISSNHLEMAKTFIIVSYIASALVGGIIGTMVAALGRKYLEPKG